MRKQVENIMYNAYIKEKLRKINKCLAVLLLNEIADAF